jgi:hypothetical protein
LADLPGLTISLNNFVYAPYEEIEVLLIPDLRTQEISGSLQITAWSGRTRADSCAIRNCRSFIAALRSRSFDQASRRRLIPAPIG